MLGIKSKRETLSKTTQKSFTAFRITSANMEHAPRFCPGVMKRRSLETVLWFGFCEVFWCLVGCSGGWGVLFALFQFGCGYFGSVVFLARFWDALAARC